MKTTQSVGTTGNTHKQQHSKLSMYTTGGASASSAAVVINEQAIQEEVDESLLKRSTASGVHPPKTSSIRHRLLEVKPPSKCLSQVRSRPRMSQN